MALSTRSVGVGILIMVIGLGLIYGLGPLAPTPTPPPCSTAACNVGVIGGTVGVLLLVFGIIYQTIVLVRSRDAPTPMAPSMAPIGAFPAPTASSETPVICGQCQRSFVVSQFPFCPFCGTAPPAPLSGAPGR